MHFFIFDKIYISAQRVFLLKGFKRGKRDLEQRPNKNSRSGQVTVFVILGIVILVIVVFGLIIYSNLKEGMINADAKKAVTAYLQSDSVNYYVNTCLDTSVSSSGTVERKSSSLYVIIWVPIRCSMRRAGQDPLS